MSERGGKLASKSCLHMAACTRVVSPPWPLHLTAPLPTWHQNVEAQLLRQLSTIAPQQPAGHTEQVASQHCGAGLWGSQRVSRAVVQDQERWRRARRYKQQWQSRKGSSILSSHRWRWLLAPGPPGAGLVAASDHQSLPLQLGW